MNPLFSRPVTAVLFLLACCAALAPLVNAEPCYKPIVAGSCELNGFSASNASIDCSDSSIPVASQPIDYYFWSFNDTERHTKTSFFTKNPEFEYPGGRLDVTHEIRSTCGRENRTTYSYTFYCNKPSSEFEVDKDTGVAPLTVHITDRTRHQSSDVTLFEYRKNGVAFSTQRSPDITFNTPGTYTITQVVRKTCNPVAPAVSSSKTITVRPITAEIIATYYLMSFGTTATTTTTIPTTTLPAAPAVTTTTAAGTIPVVTTTGLVAVTPVTPPAAPGTSPAAAGAGTPAPEPVTGTPGTGTLSVQTNPSGAQVFVDDTLRGLSPATIPELPAGEHMLRLEKAGYRNMTVPVSIGDGRTTEYSTALEAESGGPGIVTVITAVLLIAAVAGAGVWYFRKPAPGTGGQK